VRGREGGRFAHVFPRHEVDLDDLAVVLAREDDLAVAGRLRHAPALGQGRQLQPTPKSQSQQK
jgi:hypothetical protein